jgi:putative nucleotidyltransferase with HDIG domain
MTPTRRLGVGYKVVLPFLGLSLIVGLIASTVASQQTGASASAELATLAVREEDNVDSAFGAIQQRQVVDLRTLTATDGVVAAVQASNSKTLQEALYPVVANQLPDLLRVSVLDSAGHELLHLRADPTSPTRCICDGGRDLSAWPHVDDVLLGRQDSLGPKFVGVAADSDGAPILYTIGPLLASGSVVGAMMVGEPLLTLLRDLEDVGKVSLGLYLPNGTSLAASPRFPGSAPRLSLAQREAALSGTVASLDMSDGRSELYYIPWQVRGAVLGYAAVLVPSGSFTAAAGQVTPFLIGIFLAALLLTLVAGYFVSRAITRPLSTLLKATAEVAEGRLDYRAPVTSGDELGQLAESFNHMTRSLELHAKRLAESTDETVLALAATIDARDHYTHGHSVRVAAYSLALAEAAGLAQDAIDAVRRGCLVHDIGKIGTPDRILGKPRRLTAQEERVMRDHPVLGHAMLSHLDWDARVFAIVRHHHERWDGNGYPDALAGADIPELARLVAIADTLDAMTSDRPYRSAYDFRMAANEIEAGAGSQFDPDMIRVFRAARARIGHLVLTAEVPGDGVVLEMATG